MPKLNGYDYPDLKLSDAIEAAMRMKDKLRGAPATMDMLATTWGYNNSRNGAFLSKLANMRKFGFVEGRGTIRLAHLAQRIVSSVLETDKQNVLKEVIFKIPLWKEIYEIYGTNPTTENIRIAIQNITKIQPIEAEQNADKIDKISKLYMDAMSYIKDDVGSMQSQSYVPSQPIIDVPDAHQIDFEGIHIRLPKETESIDTAIQLLEMLKKKESKRQMKKE